MLEVLAAEALEGGRNGTGFGCLQYMGYHKRKAAERNFEYIDRGAEDEIALHNNRAAFDKLKFVNRVLVDVSKRKINYEFLGKPISMPFGISPTGTVGLTRYGGEVAVAQAAVGWVYPVVSTNAQTKWKKFGKSWRKSLVSTLHVARRRYAHEFY